MNMRRVAVEDVELEVWEWGHGEPVVFVQTALTADELLPLANERALDGYRKVVYHRPGYAGSSRLDRPGSIAGDASDCHGLLTAMGIRRAHVVGHSYSAAVALHLAANVPACVHTLVLMEPPPVHTRSAPEFRAANERLRRTMRESGSAVALDEFLTMVIGPNWRQAVEDRLPGSAEQMQRDASTFFDADLPALLQWEFGNEDAGRLDCPALYVGGSDSGPMVRRGSGTHAQMAATRRGRRDCGCGSFVVAYPHIRGRGCLVGLPSATPHSAHDDSMTSTFW